MGHGPVAEADRRRMIGHLRFSAIAEFLKELHLTEGRNTGFQKIIRALKANGSPMLIFETDKERTYFLSTILIHPAFMNSNEYRNDTKQGTLTDNEQLVLSALRMDATITMVKMADMLGISKATVSRATKKPKG